MQSGGSQSSMCSNRTAHMLTILARKLRRLCSRLRWLVWRRPRAKVVIRRFGKMYFKGYPRRDSSGRMREGNGSKGSFRGLTVAGKPIRIATFNAAMFSLAPAVPRSDNLDGCMSHEDENYFSFRSPIAYGASSPMSDRPRGILKQSPLSSTMNSPENVSRKPRKVMKVRINLPDNEISLAQSKLLSFMDGDKDESSSMLGGRNIRSFGNGIMRSPVCLPLNMMTNCSFNDNVGTSKSILEVLSEVKADILALQDVKAVEEKGMKPLSDLAKALGMNFVFAESWAPEYGNAILSKWPIKKWKVQKIVDDDDFRNVLRATIDVPWAGDVNFHCTQLDHLDENWRMKQMSAIINSSDTPHILAGGLNSLDASDYSWQRWADIVKYYEEIGKPTPKTVVMKFLKSKEYTDAKDYAGECEPVVIIAKGQNVQGTCKYGTRVDYLLSSSGSPYKFVPGSYSVISSKGTSDHHIVKVDMVKLRETPLLRRELSFNQNNKAVRVARSCSPRGFWRIKNT
uniref:Endonuclease/exonuclease/phosphatase domain-containing protein n=1 Tax=Kalanchoe fedtschenkoi TaxID=63787 RepID=A0A7N0ZZ86_KALFE